MNLNLTSTEKKFILGKYIQKGLSYKKAREKLFRIIQRVKKIKMEKEEEKKEKDLIDKMFRKEFDKLG